jgi:hypothetical protein
VADARLLPIYDSLVEIERKRLAMRDHFKKFEIESNAHIGNEIKLDFESAAFLVARHALPYDECILHEGQLEAVGSGVKHFHDPVMFWDCKLRVVPEDTIPRIGPVAFNEEEASSKLVPEMEITRGIPIPDVRQGRARYHRLVFNPQEHYIAVLNIFNPGISVS